jgi:hypothetical protein
VIAIGMLVLAWLVIRGGTAVLATISASLYGPPPPRVKVRSIQLTEPDQEPGT